MARLRWVRTRKRAGDDKIAAVEHAALGDDLVDQRHEVLCGAAGDDAAGGFVEEFVAAAQRDRKGIEIAELCGRNGGADEIAVGTAVAGDEVGGREGAVGDGGEVDGEFDDGDDGLDGGERLAWRGELRADVGGDDEAEFGLDVEWAVGLELNDDGSRACGLDATGFEEDPMERAVEVAGLLGGGGGEGAFVAGDFGAAGEFGADNATLGGESVGEGGVRCDGEARERSGAGVEGAEERGSVIANGGCIQKSLPPKPVEREVAPFRDG